MYAGYVVNVEKKYDMCREQKYDVVQVPQSRRGDRELQRDLKQLLETTQAECHSYVTDGASKLREVLKKSNELHNRISRPGEEVLDTQVFSLITETGAEYTRNLIKGRKNYNPANLVRHLKMHYVDSMDAIEVGRNDPYAFSWSSLGHVLSKWLHPAPVCSNMLGPMTEIPRTRRSIVGQRRRRNEILGDAVRPIELGAEENAEDNSNKETDRNLEIMWRTLCSQENETAPLLELVLNHRSFSQTIENLFTLSFLVRDARVSFEDDTDGTGIKVVARHLRRENKNTQKDQKETVERLQFVMAIDFEQWEQWKKVVKPSAELMPHREDDDHNVQLQDGEIERGNIEGSSERMEDGSGNKRRRSLRASQVGNKCSSTKRKRK